MRKIIVIIGPTGVGKTEAAIKLCKMLGNCEIVNADASQFHKSLNIGTAKIKKEEMDGIKHHLLDFLEVDDDFSIKDFQDKGREVIEKIFKSGAIPVIVGGSGLYIDALINDYKLDNVQVHNHIDDSNLSNEELYNNLVKLDNELALKTHPNNRKRVLRYIELAKSGKSVTTEKPKPIYDYEIFCLDRSRNILYDRINRRVEIMFNNGWVEEVKKLRQENVDVSKIKEIGYKDINDYLNGLKSLDDV
ncbi:MAG: tRNA (adenosine(37)-N6)-dimethylallyltransferase MiaA, partial [Bacilli bacterium]